MLLSGGFSLWAQLGHWPYVSHCTDWQLSYFKFQMSYFILFVSYFKFVCLISYLSFLISYFLFFHFLFHIIYIFVFFILISCCFLFLIFLFSQNISIFHWSETETCTCTLYMISLTLCKIWEFSRIPVVSPSAHERADSEPASPYLGGTLPNSFHLLAIRRRGISQAFVFTVW